MFRRGGRGSVSVEDQRGVDATAVETRVWSVLARKLASGAFIGSAEDLVRAAGRLVGEAGWGPLFEGAVTDRLDPEARAVRLFGPLGSGKTTCARRIVRQAVAEGRHVTIFYSGAGSDEYVFDDLSATSLGVVDAEVFRTPAHGRSEERQRRLEAIWGAFSAGGPETIVVDAWLPADDLRDLSTRLHRALSQRADTTLVVLVSRPDDLEDAGPSMVFDTELVLPGDQRVDRNAINRALRCLSSDDLTYERLVARALGGGMAESRAEEQIINWFTPFSAEERVLAQKRTRVIEPPLRTVAAGVGDRRLGYGLIKGPDGVLAEFSIAAEQPTTHT